MGGHFSNTERKLPEGLLALLALLASLGTPIGRRDAIMRRAEGLKHIPGNLDLLPGEIFEGAKPKAIWVRVYNAVAWHFE